MLLNRNSLNIHPPYW